MANTVEVTIRGVDSASGPIKGVSSALGELEGKSHSAGGALGAFGGIATTALAAVAVGAVAVVGGIGSAVNTAATFEARMSGVGAVAGASATQLAALSEKALALGQDSTLAGIGASDAAKAMEALASGGVSVADILGGAAYGALALASAGGIDVGAAAEIAAMALKNFGLAGTDAGHVADLFAAAANSSAVTVSDIGETMKYVGPIAHGMGISIEELTGTIAELGDQGIKGSSAGTALRGMITNLANPSKVAAGVMKDLGLSFFDSSGHMKNLAGISEELHTKLGGLTDQQRTAALATIFGNEGLAAAQIMYDQGAAGIEKYTAQVSVAGSAATNGALRNDNLKGALAQLGSVWETLTIRVGTAFIPVIRSAADGLSGFIANILPIVVAHLPGFIAGIERVIGAAVRFGQQVYGAVMAVVGAFRSLTSGQTNLGQFIGGMEIFVATILGKLGSLAALAAPYIGRFFSALGSAIQTYGPQVLAQLGVYAGRFSEWIKEAVPPMLSRLGELIGALLNFYGTVYIPFLISKGTELGKAAGEWINTTAIPYLKENLPKWLDAFSGWLNGTALPAIQSYWGPIVKATGDWIANDAIPYLQANLPLWLAALSDWITGTVVPAVTAGAGQIATAIGEWISTAGPAWLHDWGELGTVLGTQLGKMLTALGTWAVNIATKAGEWFSTAGPAWLHDWGELGKVLGEKIGDMLTAVGKWAGELATKAGEWFNTAGPAWLHDWGELGKVLSTELGNMVKAAGTAITNLASTIVGGLGKLAASAAAAAASIAVSIISGLVGGITAGAQRVASAAAAIVTGALEAARNAITSRSPSVKFMELGRDAIEGLIIGMEGKSDEAAATSAVIASTLATTFATTLGGYQSTLATMAGQLFGTLPAAARVEGSNLANEINAQMKQANSTVDAFAARMFGSGAGLITNLGHGIESEIPGATAKIGALAAEMQATIGKMPDNLAAIAGQLFGTGQTLVTNMADGFSEEAPGFLGLASGLGADALAQFRTFDDRAKEAGRQLFGNVQQGFQEVAPGITTMVSTLAADIAATTARITADLATMTAQFGTGGTQATATKNRATEITQALGDGLSVFDRLLPLKDKPKQVLQAMVSSMVNALDEGGKLVGQADEIYQDSITYLSKMSLASRNFEKGMALAPNGSGATAAANIFNGGPMLSPFAGGTFPALAAGGVVTKPTFALIGEAGPEAVVPLSQYNSGGGGGGGAIYLTINVAGSVVSERQLVDSVYQGLLAKKRNNTTLGL